MSLWQDIVTNALLGTERKPFVKEAAQGALGELLGRVDDSANEAALLNSAAVVALYQQAGRLPAASAATPPAVAESDERSVCNERAAQHLALMLGGTHREALGEWLAIAASASRRIPEMLLPSILNFAIIHREYQEAILPVLGNRGLWLADQNPAWGFARAIQVDEALWQTGSPEERLALLKQIRREDAAKALELICLTWQQESPQDRARFVEVLRLNLSMNDEPFLEEALDDKRKEVRKIAAELLTRMPESRLVSRMADRALLLLNYKTGAQAKFEVKLPKECDKAMTRDGLDSTSPYTYGSQKLGDKAFLFAMILKAVPIDFWRQRWKLTTRDLLELTDQTEWQKALNLAWARSALEFHDTEMAEALLREYPDKKKYLFAPLTLLDLLAADRREEIILEYLQAHGQGDDSERTIPNLISNATHLWSREFTAGVLKYFQRKAKPGESCWNSVLQGWAFHMDTITALEEFYRCQPQFKEPDDKYFLNYMGAPLQFRSEMREALATD
jgi:hypothetical protein